MLISAERTGVLTKMAEKRAPTREEIARIPERLTVLPGSSPFTSKPPEGKQNPLEKASMDITKASMDLQKQADALGSAMLSDRAMHGHSVRQQLERLVEDEEDRRELKEEMDDLEAGAVRAEEARESGDGEGLAETADDIRTGITDLGDVAGAAEALRAAGADPALIRAVLQAAHDLRAGETGAERAIYRERGRLITQMAQFYAEHLSSPGSAGIAPALQSLERSLRSLCRQAEEGTSAEAARGATREARGIYARIRGAVGDLESLDRGSAMARLRNLSGQCSAYRPLVSDGGLRREIDSLRQDLDQARRRMERGERVSEGELRGLRGRMELLQNARDSLLTGQEGRETLTLQGMAGRALSALRGGNAGQSAAHMLIAGQFVQADQDFRDRLASHSEALSAGTEQLGATLQFLSNHFASALTRLISGSGAVADERTRGFLGRIVSALRGKTPGIGRLRRASLALSSAGRLADARQRISRMHPARRRRTGR